ncbi:MAG: putative quinol monooxygenase [Octadecabacter sp.]|tara:strand:+ start:1737 stop:2051 length:315 start_codon:yes stop_codon:yes gene_type:complete
MSIVHVLAFITAKPGQRAAVLELFEANVPAVLEEDGCLAYEATIDARSAGPSQMAVGQDTFVVVERWASLDALDAHAKSEHMLAYAAKTRGLLSDRKIHVLSAA